MLIKDYLETCSYIVVLLGVPVAIYQFVRATQKEAADREYGTYNALDEKYIEFQKICFDHPALNIFDISDRAPKELSEEEKKQELIAFTVLFSIFERAFLMYHDQDSDIKARQWTGWNDYILSYCSRKNFRDAWGISGQTFDTKYQEFMLSLMPEIAKDRPVIPSCPDAPRALPKQVEA